MAHLKKFSMASKLSKLRDTRRRALDICLFGTGAEESLFFSTQRVVSVSLQARNILLDLEHTVKTYQFAYLSTNQVGLDWRAFAMQMGHKWNGVDGESRICVNPIIEGVSGHLIRDWETNQCFPFLKAQVDRYSDIRISYQGLDDEHQLELSGFMARVVQQAIDQLNGYTIFDPRINGGRWELNDKWIGVMNKTEMAMKHYKVEIDKIYNSHPEIFKQRTLEQLNTQFRENDTDFSFEEIMTTRLGRYVKREMISPLLTQQSENIDEQLYEQLKQDKSKDK